VPQTKQTSTLYILLIQFTYLIKYKLVLRKVTVRCKCQTLKKEWLCQDVQAAHNRAGSHPSEIPKNQFGVGLIPCNSDCKSKVQVVESELQLRKSRVTEVIVLLLGLIYLLSSFHPSSLQNCIVLVEIQLLKRTSLCLHCHLWL
jgi:hypothetical protein